MLVNDLLRLIIKLSRTANCLNKLSIVKSAAVNFEQSLSTQTSSQTPKFRLY